MVWENVVGALSSGKPKGADFATVLEEIIKIAEPEAPSVYVPERGWSKAGCIYDEMGRWSVAWRVHDAQFWGVPQRRKRIALVADFGGLAAPEILFVKQSLSGHFEQSGEAGEEAAGAVGGGIDHTEPISINMMIATRDKALGRGTGFGVGEPGGAAYTITSAHEHAVFCQNPVQKCAGFKHKASGTAGSVGYCEEKAPTLIEGQTSSVLTYQNTGRGWWNEEEVAATIRTPCGGDSTKANLIYDARGNGNGITVPTITGDHQNRVTDYTAIVKTYQKVTGPLMSNSHPGSYCGQDAHQDMFVISYAADGLGKYKEGVGTLRASGGNCGGGTETLVASNVVRRLTPLECTRLQGYPDGWVDIGDWIDSKGKRHKEADSPKYKALGNSIALPFWKWLLKRISAQYERDATLGSLFDGISGFPLLWAQINGLHNCRWASEIEEFPIAVCKKHFGDEETGERGDFYEAISKGVGSSC